MRLHREQSWLQYSKVHQCWRQETIHYTVLGNWPCWYTDYSMPFTIISIYQSLLSVFQVFFPKKPEPLYFLRAMQSSNSFFFPLSAPMGLPSRGGGVSRLSLPTPFSPIFVCPSAYRNLSPVRLFTHQLLPTYLQFSSSDCPVCLHRPFTYISLLYKPSFCHFSFSLWSTRDPAR